MSLKINDAYVDSVNVYRLGIADSDAGYGYKDTVRSV